MSSSTSDENHRSEPPLWAIGVAVGVIIVAPIASYSLAPTGPLREGDTIFSQGEQRAQLAKSATNSNLENTCLLDPGNPLIIIQRPSDRLEGDILAQVQGNSAIEWPFCPPHAEVRLRESQIYQTPEFLTGVKRAISRWIRRYV